MPTKKISVSIDRKLWVLLRQHKAEFGIPLSTMLTQSASRALAKKKKKRRRK